MSEKKAFTNVFRVKPVEGLLFGKYLAMPEDYFPYI